MKINDNISIDDNDIKFKFVRSSGPGGQNVNKVSSAVELYFNIEECQSISPEIRERLIKQLKGRVTRDGFIVLKSDKYRIQNLNRKDVIDKLKTILIRASRKPKKRILTIPTSNSVIKRLDGKNLAGKLKKSRKKIKFDQL